MIDHVVTDRELMRDIFDVSVQRRVECGILHHYLLLTKVRVMKKYRSDRGGENM